MKTILWITPQLDNFPRSRRFTLGERLESHLLIVLAGLVELVDASYSKQKINALKQANKQLAITRHLSRSSFELKTINQRRDHYGANLLVTLGNQIGGWIKDRE
jgi:hypothetical protein